MSDNKVVIIGAGLGGLVSGALLSKEGFNVTILEKNHRIGGGLQSYTRFDTVYDTGMHIFGGMYPGGNIERIFRYLGILDKLTVCNLDPQRNMQVHIASEARTYDLNMSREGFIDSFSQYFPEEKANLRSYAGAVERVVQKLDLFHLRHRDMASLFDSDELHMAADDFIARHIGDERLRALLALVNVLYAGEAGISPAFLHSIITTIFMNGACRLAGGYSILADALAEVVRENGGRIVTDAEVENIQFQDGLASGVSTLKTGRFDCDWLISSIHPASLLRMLPNPRVVTGSFKSYVERKKDSASAFVANIKLKKDSLEYINHLGFYLESPAYAWVNSDGSQINKLMYMTPPVIGQGRYAETLNIVAPMTWQAVERWEKSRVGHRGPEYEEFKRNILAELISKTSEMLPGLGDMIEYVDTFSPLTIRDYTGVRNGAMCGIRREAGDTLSFMPVKTRTPNLILSGQSINMHGFCGVPLTAIQSCEAILGTDHIINKL